ncbi:MAG TPA: ABC transporter permease [Acidimicrobiia bacterium]|nr:ABC transporter permease [Acidimicrobiia bacterium]
MNRIRIAAVIRRHWLVLWRSPHRWFEIAFWPVMDVVLWGSLGLFVAQENEASRAGVPYLLAGLVLFWTLTSVQMTGSVSVMEETWTRNLLNVLTTSVKPFEYILGVSVFGLAKLALTLGSLTVTTIFLFGFDMSAIGWSVIPIVTLLILNGWAVAFVVIGLILRFGQSAEILTWGLNYVVLAISGVFFPVEALPPGLRDFAGFLPTTHAFAAARAVLDGDGVPWRRLGLSTIGTAAALAVSVWFGARMLGVFRSRGFVTRYS